MIVKQNKSYITYIGDIFFYPGNNEISAEKAAELLKSSDFKTKVDLGILTIVGAEPIVGATKVEAAKAAGKAQKITVANLNVAKASEVISGIFNPAELNRLKELDPRKGIQDAIDKQLLLIQSEEETSDEEETTSEDTVEEN